MGIFGKLLPRSSSSRPPSLALISRPSSRPAGPTGPVAGTKAAGGPRGGALNPGGGSPSLVGGGPAGQTSPQTSPRHVGAGSCPRVGAVLWGFWGGFCGVLGLGGGGEGNGGWGGAGSIWGGRRWQKGGEKNKKGGGIRGKWGGLGVRLEP